MPDQLASLNQITSPRDLVCVKQLNLPPLQWKLGRIVELHSGADGMARVATFRYPT